MAIRAPSELTTIWTITLWPLNTVWRGQHSQFLHCFWKKRCEWILQSYSRHLLWDSTWRSCAQRARSLCRNTIIRWKTNTNTNAITNINATLFGFILTGICREGQHQIHPWKNTADFFIFMWRSLTTTGLLLPSSCSPVRCLQEVYSHPTFYLIFHQMKHLCFKKSTPILCLIFHVSRKVLPSYVLYLLFQGTGVFDDPPWEGYSCVLRESHLAIQIFLKRRVKGIVQHFFLLLTIKSDILDSNGVW